jgi:hypothetical protein
MPTEFCKHRHDHSKEPVAVPSEPGRKYHCPSELSANKHLEGNWKEHTLAQAQEKGIQPCQLCFG